MRAGAPLSCMAPAQFMVVGPGWCQQRAVLTLVSVIQCSWAASRGAGQCNQGSSQWGYRVCLSGCFGESAPSDGLFPLPSSGLVRLHCEHSHHRWTRDPAPLQRHHQARDSEETSWGGAALPQGPQPARRLDRGVQNPLPRQNSSPDETDPQAAPPMLLEPRDSPPKQQYSERMCHSTWPARSQGVTALLNAKKEKKTTPHTTFLPQKTHPTHPLSILLGRFFTPTTGRLLSATALPTAKPFLSPQRSIFSASQEREPRALCPGRCVVSWVFYVTCFSGHSSHKKLDLPGSGAV